MEGGESKKPTIHPSPKKRKLKHPLQQQPFLSSASAAAAATASAGGIARQHESNRSLLGVQEELLEQQRACLRAQLILEHHLANERAASSMDAAARHHSSPAASSFPSIGAASLLERPVGGDDLYYAHYRRLVESSIDLGSPFYGRSDLAGMLTGMSLPSSSLPGLSLPMASQIGLTLPAVRASIGLSDYNQTFGVERLLHREHSNITEVSDLSSVLLGSRARIPVMLLPTHHQQDVLSLQPSITQTQGVPDNIHLLRGQEVVTSNNRLADLATESAKLSVGSSTADSHASRPMAFMSASPIRQVAGSKRSYMDNDDTKKDHQDNVAATNILLDGNLEERLPLPDGKTRVRIPHFSQRQCVPLATDEDINWCVCDKLCGGLVLIVRLHLW
jgi:hypothetical protein